VHFRRYTSLSNDYRSSGGWLFDTDESIDELPLKTVVAKMPIIHIVLFEFKPTIDREQIAEVRVQPHDLKHPKSLTMV